MTDHLFIRMGESPDQATIVALNDEGHLLERPEALPLSAAASRTEGRQVTVLLPAREFVGRVAQIPAASPSRLRQMLPFSLEDEFAGDVEELHFAAGERNESGALAVSVIARDRLDFWFSVFKAVDINVRRICSEADAVPDTPGVVTLFVEGRKILGRRPGGAAFVFEELTLTELWHLLESEREDKDDLDNVVLFVDSATRQARQAEIDAWQPGIAHLDIKELADGCLPRLASGLVHRPGTNLLQGLYATRSNYAALAGPWRLAAGFALALLALSLFGKGAEVFKLSREDALLTAEAEAICRESFGSTQLSRCELEMRRRLAVAGQQAAGGGSGLFPALSVITDAAGDAMQIETLRFADNVVNLEVSVPDVGYLEPFTRAVNADGRYVATIQSNTTERDVSKARLQIVALAP